MTKKEAIQIFGSVKKIADAIGTTTQNFYMFADPLSLANSDRVIGAAIRCGFDVPQHVIHNIK